ncbi:MAG: FMN-binding protein [Treponema sp.]|nr:FMN-binding protein [Treponema sp.]
MKKAFLTALIICILLLIGCTTAWKSLQASLPDINNKPDGVYHGEYSVSGTPVQVDLEVTVNSGRLSEIKILKHKSSPIGKKAEAIIGSIIDKQSLDVDAVTGATASSKGILMAVENALQ